jgi:hypothetical protein
MMVEATRGNTFPDEPDCVSDTNPESKSEAINESNGRFPAAIFQLGVKIGNPRRARRKHMCTIYYEIAVPLDKKGAEVA